MIRGELTYTPKHRIALETLIAESPAMSRAAAGEVAQLIREGNRVDRLQGVGADGIPLKPVTVRINQYFGAAGPPLAPFGESSRSITQFYTRIETSPYGWTVTAGYSGDVAKILRWHAEGKSGSGTPIVKAGAVVGFRGIPGKVTGIKRDVMGVGPLTMQEIGYVIGRQKSWIRDVLRGLPFVSTGYGSSGRW
jgi:hypothetical protein